MRILRTSVLALTVLMFPARGSAHLDMTSPTSRYGADALKSGPCGIAGGQRTQNVTYFEPGATIEVRWNEYIDHPSHYRIAFDADGDDDFVDPRTMLELYSNDAVLLDGIEDQDATDPIYRATVQLPDIECSNCTLQLIQVMYDKPPYEVGGDDVYYQCADIILTKDPPPNPAAPNPGAEETASQSGGCTTVQARAHGLWLIALGLWMIRRRLGGTRGLTV